MTESTSARRHGLSPRALAATVLLLLTVVGVLAGIALDRGVLLPRHFGPGMHHHHPPGRPSPGRHLFREPSPEQEAAMRRDFSARLTRNLHLAPAQQVRVDSILVHQAEEWRSLRQDVRPRLQRIFSAFRDSLDVILTPEQRERFQAMRREHGGPDSAETVP